MVFLLVVEQVISQHGYHPVLSRETVVLRLERVSKLQHIFIGDGELGLVDMANDLGFKRP